MESRDTIKKTEIVLINLKKDANYKIFLVCYSGEYDKACRVNNTGNWTDQTYYLRQCMTIGEICTTTGFEPFDGQFCWDGTQTIPWYTNVTRTLAAEEYYK